MSSRVAVRLTVAGSGIQRGGQEGAWSIRAGEVAQGRRRRGGALEGGRRVGTRERRWAKAEGDESAERENFELPSLSTWPQALRAMTRVLLINFATLPKISFPAQLSLPSSFFSRPCSFPRPTSARAHASPTPRLSCRIPTARPKPFSPVVRRHLSLLSRLFSIFRVHSRHPRPGFDVSVRGGA